MPNKFHGKNFQTNKSSTIHCQIDLALVLWNGMLPICNLSVGIILKLIDDLSSRKFGTTTHYLFFNMFE